MSELKTASLNEATLTLFFTRRTGLCDWDRTGNLEREVQLYRRLGGSLKRVNFITYGGGQDRAYSPRIAPIQVCPIARHLPISVSRRLLRMSHSSLLCETDIFKTNQVAGAEVATWLKRKFGKKLITRCGYLYSRFMEERTANAHRIRRAYAIEHEAFTVADAVIVTTERDRQWSMESHGLHPEKIHVIPNYVLTDVFKPAPDVQKTHDLVCIAKASPQKNLNALLEAMQYLKRDIGDLSCMLIGSAAADGQLRRRAEQYDLDITFLARVPHLDLPDYLNRCRVFVLPSLYEGHPKALLEAMSCGLPCIGTDVVGIREDLSHRQNGYLCKTDPVSLAGAIKQVLEDADLQQELGRNARQHVKSRYDIEKVLELELRLMQRLL